MKRIATMLLPNKRRAYRRARKRYDPDRVIRSFLHVLERLRPVLQGGGPAPHGVYRDKP
jgi:hypothetical protein